MIPASSNVYHYAIKQMPYVVVDPIFLTAPTGCQCRVYQFGPSLPSVFRDLSSASLQLSIFVAVVGSNIRAVDLCEDHSDGIQQCVVGGCPPTASCRYS